MYRRLIIISLIILFALAVFVAAGGYAFVWWWNSNYQRWVREQIAMADELYQKGDVEMSTEQLIRLAPHSDYRDELKSRLLGMAHDPQVVRVLTEKIDTAPYLVAEILVSTDPPSIEAMTICLKNGNSLSREAICRELVNIETARSKKMLIDSLKDEGWSVRGTAIYSLAKMKCSEAVEPLIKKLSDTMENNRRLAAWALGQIGDRRALPALEHLAETDPHQYENGVYGVREAARRAIKLIKFINNLGSIEPVDEVSLKINRNLD